MTDRPDDVDDPHLSGPTGAPGSVQGTDAPDARPAPAAAYPPAAQQPHRNLPLVLASVASALVLGAALVAPLVDRAIRGDERAQRALDLTLVETWEITDGTHTEGDVDYPQDPPAGGPHAPIWLDCGVYDEPVREENAVHDLEHGTVWITHDPDLSDSDRALLAEQLPANGIMSPREDLPSPVVVTVWGAQLHLDGADDRRLGLFLEEYGDGHTAPEFGVSCRGGTPDPQGGLPGAGTNA
ncbi:DUF3105 domain-containing protein [Nocardioides sp. zg-1228]|uniref:DUF3105 domain-containing protein n=1 Tax=Nocardioides sp. zg-1228 TaxID=2763008 RepID=UPI0016435DDC|nr:DUF3105 domain-containing protein [Nocardioides sp. zg-1228]MBC2934515.1 DUF3105 domain-containing protein [Nocardioides sp. zg-1228]QSF59273.1 DUF3105 domain-containing protein [Nocardioides sp. zg-1228]